MLENKVLMQNAATSGNGTVMTLDGQHDHVRFFVIGSSGVTAGAVTIEEAHTADYAGTWAELQVVTVTASAVQTVYQACGSMLHTRARVSTTVTGGTVSVIGVAASGAGA